MVLGARMASVCHPPGEVAALLPLEKAVSESPTHLGVSRAVANAQDCKLGVRHSVICITLVGERALHPNEEDERHQSLGEPRSRGNRYQTEPAMRPTAICSW